MLYLPLEEVLFLGQRAPGTQPESGGALGAPEILMAILLFFFLINIFFSPPKPFWENVLGARFRRFGVEW